MNPEMIKALEEMQKAGWGVGGRLVEEEPSITANYYIGENVSQDEQRERNI